MKILVIGSKGTLGAPLTDELVARGHHVYEADLMHSGGDNFERCDISSRLQVDRLFDSRRFDLVYLLAAEFGRHNGEDYYDTLWRTNVIGTRHILEAQARHGFRLVFTSSSEIYGETGAEWLSEDMAAQFHQPNDYAITKWVNELQIQNFAAKHGTETVRLRLFNAYGPGEHYHRYRSVVCLFSYCALRGLPYDVYQGYHRVFMYIDDLIPTMANVADAFTPGEVYNVGGREYRSVEDLSALIQKYAGNTAVNLLPEDAHNVKCKRPVIDKAIRDLGHDPRVTLEEGIPKTIDWMRMAYQFP